MVQRILRLAMLAVGISCAITQVARGGAVHKQSGQGISTVSAQTGAEMPRIENARVETRAAGESLASAFREILEKAEKPEWVGYSVDEVAGERGVCCDNNWNDERCGTCRLENDHNWNGGTTREGNQPAGTVKLEGERKIVVLYRLEAKNIMRIRMASESCSLDVGGLQFIWLTGVQASESVALLETYVHGAPFESHGDHGIGQGALSAIALHADASADRAMQSFVAPEQPEGLRRQAAFWLGVARGNAGLEALRRMAKNDPTSDVRAHVAFALSVSHESGAVDEMIHMAHADASSHVRGQALFWLAQKAGKKAVGTITGAIENDPDTDVKKKAVFALSQLPKDEGVPKLIEVAQTNHNAEVRKQAMFWLGQSNDPRALQFFEKILTQ
ncbi:MAG TPA: HEAT repeat domain-containing protein [Candidatus Acidoferrum sp.]|nr:HEAT repeat domain-containing protein [Candidatus Acidoferrum sp.]